MLADYSHDMRLRLATALALGVIAFPRAQAPDPQTIGPKVGERAPDFSLRDQRGVTRTLRSTFGPKGAVLVFFRSADW
jgi:hypothetical protein